MNARKTSFFRESEAQLRQSQKLHAIGQLAGGVAHDFNNLLTVIMGYADTILSDMDASHPLLDAARHIQDAGERATLLTRQLLHFGRKAILEPRALDLNTAIRNTGDMLTRLIGEDVSLVAWLAPSLSLASVDRGQLEQVIVNLCLNARDAMPQGGRILVEDEDGVRRLARLSLERHGYTVLEADGGHAAIELADAYTGPIDILLTDVVMSGLNGREVSERLLARRPELKVLFMSGYNDDAVVRHGIMGSPAAFLQKPFDSRTLATKLRDVLGHSATAPAATTQPAAG